MCFSRDRDMIGRKERKGGVPSRGMYNRKSDILKRRINSSVLSFFVFAVFLITSGYAQKRVDIGVKAGLSIPNLTAGDSDNPINSGYSSITGPAAAVFAEFHLSERFSVQPELQYCAEGGRKNGKQAFSIPPEYGGFFPPGEIPQYLYADYKSSARFNYLILPVLAKLHFLESSRRLDIYAAAGPFVSFLVSAKNETSGKSNIYLDSDHTVILAPDIPFDMTRDIRNELHKVNAGLNAFLGVAYHFGKSSILLEAGGNYGLIDIQKGDVNGKNKTGAFVTSLGYSLSIGRN